MIYRLPAVILFTLLSGIVCAETRASGMPQWLQKNRPLLESLSISRLPASASDPGNRYQQHPQAIELGRKLFFDRRLSRNGRVSCASCHQAERFFSDGLVSAQGLAAGRRNTPSLLGVSHNSWFFWDGRKDSLWAQALAPLEDKNEHALTRTELVRLVWTIPEYQGFLKTLLEQEPPERLYALSPVAMPSGTVAQIRAWKHLKPQQRRQIDSTFAVLGKALAAYVNTLKPPRQALDDYIEAVQQGESSDASSSLSAEEIQGLRLFLGKAACINCHSGPLMTNQGFHNIGTGKAGDSGRAAVLDEVRFDRFNCLGEFSDAQQEDCTELKYMQRDRRHLWGAFKTPALRNVANTAPYFHDGRMKTLSDVVEHYSQPQLAGQTDLPAVQLNAEEKQQLIAFLKTLKAQ